MHENFFVVPVAQNNFFKNIQTGKTKQNINSIPPTCCLNSRPQPSPSSGYDTMCPCMWLCGLSSHLSISIPENRKRTSRCTHARVCDRVLCVSSHTHFPRLFSAEISFYVGHGPRRARGLPWPKPRVYSALGTVSRVPKGPRGKEELRRMQGGGGELVAGNPTLSAVFWNRQRLRRTNTFSSDASKTSQNTKIFPGVYINFTQQGETTEKKLGPARGCAWLHLQDKK